MGKVNRIPVRRLPRHRIVTLLKARGIRQCDIALLAGVNQPQVSKVIGRQVRDSEGAERVWQEIERALEGGAA